MHRYYDVSAQEKPTSYSPARSASAVCGCRRCELRAPIHPSGTFPRRRWKRIESRSESLDQMPTCKPP